MLTPHVPQRGVTLIELAIGLSITAIVIAAGVPSFMEWMQNAQVRTAAESLQSGLQLARGEAVRRNLPVIFQLTDSLANSCAVSTSGTGWVVSLSPAASKCGNAPAEPPASTADWDSSDPSWPYIVRTGSTSEGALNAKVSSSEVVVSGTAAYAGSIVFNGWGRVSTASLGTGNSVRIDITNPQLGTCLASNPPGTGEKVRCLRLLVSSTGQIQMCDPYLKVIDPTAPGACP